MKGLRLRRPSPAFVLALIALMVAMGGTGYAAFKLPKNSVGTKQLKKNAVTGAKVKDHSLTGSDINLGKLGKVPTATHADSADNANHAAVADSANAIAAPEAVHLIGAPGEPAFQSGSSNLVLPPFAGFQFQPAGFYKDREGIVHLQGVVKIGTGGPPSGVIFTLPPGYRPASGRMSIFTAICESESGICAEDSASSEESYSAVRVAGSNTRAGSTPTDGDVLGQGGTSLTLDGIAFRAES